jgi:cytochrome b561
MRTITMTRAPSTHYTAVAITLHWLTAIAILGLLVAGLWMTDAIKQPETKALAYKVYQWHKALGLTVLVLSIARLAWRLMNPPPPLPEGMSGFERFAARITHVAFYALIIGMPLTGWAMVSASPFGLPTIVFGLFEWPHIPWLAAIDDKKPVEAVFRNAHEALGLALMALLALHVAAALKHHFVNRDEVLVRMLPGRWMRKRRT